jgi:hypothetical protein
MLDVAIIGADIAMADVLYDVCQGTKEVVRGAEVRKMTAAEELRGLHVAKGVVIIHASDFAGADELLQRTLSIINQLGANWSVLVHLQDDEPEDAFKLIAKGAFHVLAVARNPISADASSTSSDAQTLLGKLCDLLYPVLTHIDSPRCHEPPLPAKFLPSKIASTDRVFISMKYNARRNSGAELDYVFAIEPAMRRLGLTVKLSREIHTGHPRDLNKKLFEEISKARVVLLLAREFTHFVAYEMGVVDALLHLRSLGASSVLESLIPICPLYVTPDPMAENLVLERYANRTDLALQLFYGLGGTYHDLRVGSPTLGGGE